MGKRGMLPKFRPAALGTETLARPSIRPVKPGPPPPVPSPPRKINSGFGVRGGVAAHAEPFVIVAVDDELEPPTATGNGEPSTLNRGPETLPLDTARNARRGRANVVVSFEDETQARPADEHLLGAIRSDIVTPVEAARPADLGVVYESLPSLEVRPKYDTYEEAFSERDPVTMMHGARESARVRRADASPDTETAFRKEPSYNKEPSYKEPSYKEPSYKEPSYREASYKEPPPSYREPESRKEPSYREPDYEAYLEPSYPAPMHANDQEFFPSASPARREESGPRERPVPPPAQSYAAPVPAYDDASDSAQWGRDGSLPPSSHQAPRQHGWSSMPAQPPEYAPEPQPMIPPAPQVPEDIHPAFVQGVQPLRRATPQEAWGSPQGRPRTLMGGMQASPQLQQMQQMQSSMPPPQMQMQAPQHAQHHQYVQQQMQQLQQQMLQQQYEQQQQYAQQQQQQYVPPLYAPQAPQYASQPPMPMPMGAVPSSNYPVGAQLTAPPNAAGANKVGRFAWFLAGAAFGITFAFFATGFFAAGKANNEFPPAAPLPALTAAATAAAPTAPPVAQGPAAPVAAPAVAAAAVPAAGVPAAAAPAPVASTTNVNALPKAGAAAAAAAPPPPVRQAPPPPPPRVRAQFRRPAAPPAGAGPKNLGGGGAGADDPPSAPAPAPPSGGGDFGDLLGAGLKP